MCCKEWGPQQRYWLWQGHRNTSMNEATCKNLNYQVLRPLQWKWMRPNKREWNLWLSGWACQEAIQCGRERSPHSEGETQDHAQGTQQQLSRKLIPINWIWQLLNWRTSRGLMTARKWDRLPVCNQVHAFVSNCMFCVFIQNSTVVHCMPHLLMQRPMYST